jgi:hypothetical protein
LRERLVKASEGGGFLSDDAVGKCYIAEAGDLTLAGTEHPLEKFFDCPAPGFILDVGGDNEPSVGGDGIGVGGGGVE